MGWGRVGEAGHSLLSTGLQPPWGPQLVSWDSVLLRACTQGGDVFTTKILPRILVVLPDVKDTISTSLKQTAGGYVDAVVLRNWPSVIFGRLGNCFC